MSLLARGADLTKQNSKHRATHLHIAARYGHREAVSAFIDYGCALGCADRYGITPALHALKNGHEDIASALDNDDLQEGMLDNPLLQLRVLLVYMIKNLIQ